MKPDGTVSASEISEYSFCSVAWYMDKNGYPRSAHSSRRMEQGRRMHQKLEPKYRQVTLASKISIGGAIIVVLLFVALALGLI